MDFIDLAAQQRRISDKLQANIAGVLSHGQYINGPEVRELEEAGVPTAIYYPKPLHLQAAFAYLDYRQGDFPVSEECAGRIFSLPMHPYLAAGHQRHIAGLLQ